MSTLCTDSRTRFIFDNMPVRGLILQLNTVWQTILNRKTYPKIVRKPLGELLGAALLLSSTIKFDGSLIIQIQGKGPISLMVVESHSNMSCRATARYDENITSDLNTPIQELLGKDALCAITIQPNEGETWQGIVPLMGQNISDIIMSYMRHSEQLDTHIMLLSDENSINGLLLQKLPETNTEKAENDWEEVLALANTLTDQELKTLDPQTLVYRLFHQETIRLLEKEGIHFSCTCSYEKVSHMLNLLDKKEIDQSLLEEGSIEIVCDFCGLNYVFDEEDIDKLLGPLDTQTH